MKNLFVTGLVFISAMAGATSLKRPDTRLQLAYRNLGFGVEQARHKTVLITVSQNGLVRGMKCFEKRSFKPGPVDQQVSYVECSDDKTLEVLSLNEVRRLNRKIEKARDGEIIYPDPRAIHCLAMPTISERATADNGNILLFTGSRPCGKRTYNDSKAAAELSEDLNDYLNTYLDQVN